MNTPENQALLDGEQLWRLPIGEDEWLGGYLRSGSSSKPIGLFVHGFKSHCDGEKARQLSINAGLNRLNWLRFDQRGSRSSSGRFQEFTLSRGLEDLSRVLDHLKQRKAILIGSSLGGLLSLRAASQYQERIAGLLLIAPALRFVQRLVTDEITEHGLQVWRSRGYRWFPDLYEGGTYRLNSTFLEDLGNWTQAPEQLHCPIRVIHGDEDELLPVSDSQRWLETLECPSKALEIVPGGDHQLNQWTELIRHHTNLLWNEVFSV